jgi:hypothetical protein
MGYVQCLKTQHAAGTLFNTYTTAKSVINSQAIARIPGDCAPLQLGDMLHVRVSGGVSNIVTAQPTFTFQAMMGPAIPATIIVHASQACLTTTTAHTLIPFEYDLWMRLDSEGSGTAAKFLSQGHLSGIMFPISGAVADPTLSIGDLMAPATAPAVGTGFDSTVANYLDFFVGISVSSASNGIQIYHYSVDLHSERN